MFIVLEKKNVKSTYSLSFILLLVHNKFVIKNLHKVQDSSLTQITSFY